jgi:hypothetical protein
MSAGSALTVVGQVAGYALGGPIGGAIGGMIGGTIGGAIDGPVRNQQAMISDLGALKIDYGSTIPRMHGRYRFPVVPNIWSSTKRAIEHEEEVDSKGGPSAVNATYTYEQDWWCLAPLNATGFARVWVNKKLIYSVLQGTDDATIDASLNTAAWVDIGFMDGAADQQPWSIYEAAVGAENAIAYRHRPSLWIEGLDLGASGQPPLIEVEFYTSGSGSAQSSGRFAGANSGVGLEPLFPDDLIVEAGMALFLVVTHTGIGHTCTVGGGSWGNQIVTETQSDSTARVRVFNRVADGTIGDAAMGIVISGTEEAMWTIIAVEGPDDSFFPLNTRADGGLEGGGGINPPGLTMTGATNWLMFAIASVRIGNLPYYAGGGIISIPAGYDPISHLNYARGANSQVVTSVAYKHVENMESENPGGFGESGSGGECALVFGIEFAVAGGGITIDTVDLEDVARNEALLEWTGETGALTDDDIDFTAFAGTEVTGIAFAGSPREALAQLSDDYFLLWACSDKLYGRRRGEDPVKTIPYDETGAGVGRSADPFTGLERGNDLEVALQVAYTSPNLLRDYEPGTESSDTLVGVSKEVRKFNSPSVFSPTEQKGRSQTINDDSRVAAHTGKISLDDRHVDLEPSDVVSVYDDEGNLYRLLLLRETYADGAREFDVRLDDPHALQPVGVTTEIDDRAISVVTPPDSEMILMDAPALDDSSDYAGPLIAVSGEGEWPGAKIVKSADDATFSGVATVISSSVTGAIVTPPVDWTGGNLFDRESVMRVRVIGTLTSSTREAVLGSTTTNLIGIVHPTLFTIEAIQFVNADLVEEGIYDLSMLLRGRYGTEQNAHDHAVDHEVVLLNSSGKAKPASSTGEIGATRYYKPVTLGRAVDSVLSEAFVDNGVAKKPYAVAHLRSVDNGDGTHDLTWSRRSRLACRFMGPLGSSIPLGEDSESYAVDVVDGSDVVQSTQTVSAATATVTATAGWTARVYQVSATVGRGYETEITL